MKQTISAVVVYAPFKNGNVQRCNTHISIRADGREIATLLAGGRYSQVDALKEFKRNPKRFIPKDMGMETLQAIAKVA